MKEKYDFSQGKRGQFYNPDAVFKEPVYLDEEVQNYRLPAPTPKASPYPNWSITCCARISS
jgi:hypothetical protein